VCKAKTITEQRFGSGKDMLTLISGPSLTRTAKIGQMSKVNLFIVLLLPTTILLLLTVSICWRAKRNFILFYLQGQLIFHTSTASIRAAGLFSTFLATRSFLST
jgi:hypothetical protein